MANKFSKGHVFVPGEVVDPDDLNDLVDLALPLKALINDQTLVTAATNDQVLITDTSDSGNLKRSLVSTFPSGATSIDFDAGNPAPTTIFSGNVSPTTGDALITLGLKNQGANKVLAGPVTGSATPSFRVLSPSDTSNFVSIAADLIDLTLSNAFYKHLTTTPFTLKFTAGTGSAGQVFKVRVKQKSVAPVAVLHWSSPSGSILWPGGTEPVLTATLDAFDVFEFLCVGTDDYLGIRWGANFS